jgi:LAGLIDADG DNA endonuclease family
MATFAYEVLKPKLFEITTGLLLGDGNLQKPKSCKYYRLRFTQNSIRQDYVNHVLKLYKHGLQKINCISPFSKEKWLVIRNDPRIYKYIPSKNKLTKVSLNFETRISSAFNQHAKIFYANHSSKKNLCYDLSCFYDIVTPTALAYWYMDDGTWPNKESKSFMLCTHGYQIEQVWYLSELLNKKFGLITTVQFNKKQPIIRISAKSYKVFKELIYKTLILIPSMQTKFPFD